MAFGEGPRVYVRSADGTGIALKDVRVERVDGDGTQHVTVESWDYWDVDVIAEAVEARRVR